jgi:rubrerythrin
VAYNVKRNLFEGLRNFMPVTEKDNPVPVESDDNPSVWRCRECGFIHYGSEPPEFCPVCGQPGREFDPIKSGRKKFL